MGKAEAISNPRRILAVALEGETDLLGRVVKDLTGTQPEAISSTLAGTTHDLKLETNYYTTTVPVWLDLITVPDEWAASFLTEEAKEVLEVLGGVIVVFAIPTSTSPSSSCQGLIKEVGRVVKEGLGGWEWDGVTLAVGVGEVDHLDDLDTWDEVCGDAGLEFVHVASSVAADTKNEFGEKVGIPRVLEALESNDWASVPTIGAEDANDFLIQDKESHSNEEEHDSDLDLENLDFGFDREDFEGLKKAIWEARMEREGLVDAEQSREAESADTEGIEKDDDELGEDDVKKVEQMMRKLQAVRDMSAGLPEEQRKRVAARAVGEVMRDL
ncbi:hypothetical protein N0V93_006527 [Gnomoniopsis smithogilvyi]|uniref:Alpha and gamma adaptin binding protein p34 n=1 Tax=Gnomoniopsis smithogilvyi TaxID=1191159 RepID=A0A9W8YNT0_9PEZI|nr:hypothetical protein N0V93_006527 [Gnomoniopsis smithogilvyi]